MGTTGSIIAIVGLIISLGYIVYLKNKVAFFQGMATVYARELHKIKEEENE